MIIRFLHAYQFKHPKVYKNMISHMEWRNTNLPPRITSNTFNNFLVFSANLKKKIILFYRITEFYTFMAGIVVFDL